MFKKIIKSHCLLVGHKGSNMFKFKAEIEITSHKNYPLDILEHWVNYHLRKELFAEKERGGTEIIDIKVVKMRGERR